jgi:phosphoribosyl-AMP cyclohydrolase
LKYAYNETKPVNWLDEIKWDANGLVPVIAQDYQTGKVLMFAWMNREALLLTDDTKQVVYWSRSRNKLWRKGEESGHTQKVHEIRVDCDEDVILLMVEQMGGIACHTGRDNCFFKKLEHGNWLIDQAVIKDPKEIYHD